MTAPNPNPARSTISPWLTPPVLVPIALIVLVVVYVALLHAR